jgi:twinkle protein
VLGLERNGQAEDEVERNTTHVRVLKNRFSGITGPACDLLYSLETGRMKEIREQDLEEAL